jgi:hypothetical protein
MISVLEAMSEAMRMRASCGAFPPGSNMRRAVPSTGGPGIYLRRGVSLVRARCPGCGAEITCAFDGAVVRLCEYAAPGCLPPTRFSP